MNNLKVGSFLQALRKYKGLTQADVAEYFDVSPKTVSKWECGDALPEVPMLKALAEFYEVTVDEMLNGEKGKAVENSDTLNSKVRVEYNRYLYQKKNKLLTIFFIASLGLISIAFFLFFVILNALGRYKLGSDSTATSTYCLISAISLIMLIIALYILRIDKDELEPTHYLKFRRKKYIYLYSAIALILFGFVTVILNADDGASFLIYYAILLGLLAGIAVVFVALYFIIPLLIRKKNK